MSENANTADEAPVGVVGVGTMGSAAAALQRPHRPVVVWDVSAAALQREREAGSLVASTPAALAAQARVVLLFLPGPEQVREIVSGDKGLLTSSGGLPDVIVDLSTVDPSTTMAMAEAAAVHDVAYLDAPVLGRPHRCGSWTLPVGGDRADLERASPVLDRLAARIALVGGHGAGNTIKLMNNMMLGAINAITAETMAAAAASGVELATYVEVLADSGAASISPLFREIAPKIVAEDWTPTFTIDLLEKDNRLALEVMHALGVRAPVAEAVCAKNRLAREHGLGGLDTSAMVNMA